MTTKVQERKLLTYQDLRCPIRLPASEFMPGHRCNSLAADGLCNLHGNVTKYQKEYARTHLLTEESDLPKRVVSKDTSFRGRFVAFARSILFDESV